MAGNDWMPQGATEATETSTVTPAPSGAAGTWMPQGAKETVGDSTPTEKPIGKPFYDAIGANMTPAMKVAHPVLSGIEQTAQDVSTLGEKAANGLTLGGLNYGLKKAGIQPPNFDNTAPENKSGMNLMGDAVSLGAGNKTIGTIGSKVVAPIAKGVAKAVPEGLKNTSYALMQSIVNQLPKEFKYGANAGRAMVKEGFSGDAAAIKDQADNRLDEIKGQGDALASSSNKPVNNSNAIKIIDDKIAELQSKSPRTSAATISKLMNSKKDLLGVKEQQVLDPSTSKYDTMEGAGKDVSNMTPKETLDLKRDFDDHTAWKGTASDDSVYNKTMQQARTQLKDNLNDAAPGMKEWNQRYADLRAAQQASGRAADYAKAGAGLSNLINNAVRGTVGITTLGAALTGHGATAGEIIAGWGAKEVLGNPMVKSKLAQALYGLSEADKMAIFKAAPWMCKAVNDVMNNFRQKPNPHGEPVDAELVDNRPLSIGQQKPMVRNDRMLPGQVGTSDGSVINQPGYVPPGLPNNAVGRNGINPSTPMGGLPDPGNTAIRQPGFVPKGLPEPFQGRSGVDRPWENKGLPTPNQTGRSPIPMGGKVLDKDALATNKPPAGGPTTLAGQLYTKMKTPQGVNLHPAEDVRSGIKNLNEQIANHPDASLAKNMGIAPTQVDHLRDIKGLLENSEKGTNQGFSTSGGMQGERTHWYTKSNMPESLKGKYSQNELADMLGKKLEGGKVTPGQSLVIKKLLKHFFPSS